MGFGTSYDGASGNRYTFALTLVDGVTGIPVQGGVLVFATLDGYPVWVGYADSAHHFLTDGPLYLIAKERFDVELVYFHASSRAEGEGIVADLIEYYRPLLNRHDKDTEDQE